MTIKTQLPPLADLIEVRRRPMSKVKTPAEHIVTEFLRVIPGKAAKPGARARKLVKALRAAGYDL